VKRSRDDLLFLLGVTLWIAVIAATWPRALSFSDEVSYVSRAKLLVAGHLHYVPGSPGAWVKGPHGVVGQYPLLYSVLLAPLVAITPNASFALSIASAILLAATAAAALRSWGRSPLWGLVVLAHPTICILSRTAMADVPQAAVAVAAWWACRRGRVAATLAWLTILVALKQTGGVLAFAIVAGEAASSWSALRGRDPAALRRVAAGVAGGVLGALVALAQNRIANGTFASGYDTVFEHIAPFSLSYLRARAPVHLTTLLLEPPLLVAGAWTFWRRRDFGPLFVIGGFFALMCVYVWADSGVTRVETLVLSPRLILPVIAFLLIGYAAWLDGLLGRLRRSAPGDGPPSTPGGAPNAPALAPAWLAAGLLTVTLASGGALSYVHWRQQQAMGIVLDVASAVADAHGERTLGVTPNALKAGVLHNGPTTLFDPVSNRTAAVLCAEVSASHRAREAHFSCRFPGYHPINSRDGFFALARDDAGGDAL
jgi:hypothetical protein